MWSVVGVILLVIGILLLIAGAALWFNNGNSAKMQWYVYALLIAGIIFFILGIIFIAYWYWVTATIPQVVMQPQLVQSQVLTQPQVLVQQ
jgi:membrane-bound ClpP family serine protease